MSSAAATFRAVHQDGTTARLTGDLPAVIRAVAGNDHALTFVVASDGATVRVWASARHYHTNPPIIVITREDHRHAP